MYEHIPAELKQLPQWVCWQAQPDVANPDKLRKMPINPRTGGNAMSNNPSTWTTYDEAVSASVRFSGIGFMFGGDYFGVDLDHIDADIAAWKASDGAPQLPNMVAEFVNSLESYAEYSQSGAGIHIICRGRLPEGGRRRKNVEMYQSERFFIMTGNIAAKYTKINDCTESIRPLHERYIGGGRAPTANLPTCATVPLALDDAQIIELAGKSKQGDVFKQLYAGDWQALYNSQSEADMRLCGMLAFYTRRNATQIDAIFRASGLMRAKWDQRRGAATYGETTVAKAIRDCRAVYEPREPYRVTIDAADADADVDQQRQPALDAQVSTGVQVPERIYTFDDTGNAQRYIDMFGPYIRYSYVDKKWLYYDGRKWCQDMCGAVNRMMDETIEAFRRQYDYYMQNVPSGADPDEYAKALVKHIKSCRASKSKTAALHEGEHHVPIMPEQLDMYPFLLNTLDGVLNLTTGELLPHNPELYLSKITNSGYSENADCLQWEQFLRDIFQNDAELISYIQQALGYALTGSTQEQCMFFLYGDGKNGKSTFLEVLADILGDYACNIQSETVMAKRGSTGSANSDIARLKGARLVTCAEPNEGARFDEGLIKQLTGGDRVTARKLYGEEFEFHCAFKLFMAGNHKPVIRGTDAGIWRRIHLIPFSAVIPENKRDPNLRFKLRQEAAGILRWIVNGSLQWQRAGSLPMPVAVREATREYRNEMDVVGSFLAECTSDAPGTVGASALFKTYLAWAEENNEYKMSNTKFGREIAKRYQRGRASNGNGNVYNGLRINPESLPYKVKFG